MAARPRRSRASRRASRRSAPSPPCRRARTTVTEEPPPDVGGTWSLATRRLLAGEPAQGVRRTAAREIVVPDEPGHGLQVHQRLHASRQHHAEQAHARGHRLDAVPGAARVRRPRPEREQIATTTAPGCPAHASGDASTASRSARTRSRRRSAGDDRWELAGVQCDGVPGAGGRGPDPDRADGREPGARLHVHQPADPDVIPPDPEPPAPGPPGPPAEAGPEGGIAGAEVASARANLVVTKRVRPRARPARRRPPLPDQWS